MTQVEACLNSRPLCKMSDDPNDLKSLTPAHFLIGEPINLFPDEGNYVEMPSNRLNRWELLQRIMQDFWKRWHSEYLHTLLNRPKWNKVYRNFERDDLVIIKEDNLPPARWKMGRIVETLPGPNGLVRSVVLRTANGNLRRPIVKLAFLEHHVEPDVDEDGNMTPSENNDEPNIDRLDVSEQDSEASFRNSF